MGRGQRLLKRGTDVLLSVTALAVASPVLAASAVAVRVRLGRPVLFRQQRPGLNGRPFTMIKLRTMLTPEQAGQNGDEARLTPLGRFLRATSIDELPTLWNVLRGEMSLVGPRPLLMQYLPLYSAEQARRHEVRPGLTGLAQVRGRNSLSWEEKFAADVEYVDEQSLLLDACIVLDTVRMVLQRSGINHGGAATMPRFTGGTTGEQAP